MSKIDKLNASKKYTALVLQGGGALGAFEYGAVKRLYEQDDFSPDVITGVSIGAITAAVLTGSKFGPIEGLKRLWDMLTFPEMPYVPNRVQLMMSMPRNPAMYGPNMQWLFNPCDATSYSDTAPLYDTLEKLIDLDKLNSTDSPELIITATNVKTGEIEAFNNRTTKLTFEHIVASCSLPPSFPMTKIDYQYYWDGGVYSNTPLAPALNRLESYGTEADCIREIILIELFSRAGTIPKNLVDVQDRMLDLSFASRMLNDKKMFERVNKNIDLFHQIDELFLKNPDDADIKDIRNNEAYKKLLNYKKIHRFTAIEYHGAEALTGGSDFTHYMIEQRIAAGYTAVCDILNEQKQQAAVQSAEPTVQQSKLKPTRKKSAEKVE